MLAYSSIAHAGYLLVALVSANDFGKGAVLFYLLTYAVTNLGAFGILAILESPDRPNDQIRDFAGLWNTHPVLATLMTIFLLSLGGFPVDAVGLEAHGTTLDTWYEPGEDDDVPSVRWEQFEL